MAITLAELEYSEESVKARLGRIHEGLDEAEQSMQSLAVRLITLHHRLDVVEREAANDIQGCVQEVLALRTDMAWVKQQKTLMRDMAKMLTKLQEMYSE